MRSYNLYCTTVQSIITSKQKPVLRTVELKLFSGHLSRNAQRQPSHESSNKKTYSTKMAANSRFKILFLYYLDNKIERL